MFALSGLMRAVLHACMTQSLPIQIPVGWMTEQRSAFSSGLVAFSRTLQLTDQSSRAAAMSARDRQQRLAVAFVITVVLTWTH